MHYYRFELYVLNQQRLRQNQSEKDYEQSYRQSENFKLSNNRIFSVSDTQKFVLTDSKAQYILRKYLRREKKYITLDLKSFYFSVECRKHSLNPLSANLIVAD